MTGEARIDETGHGLAPQGAGWFVLNAREARWRRSPGRGHSLPFTGWTDEECESLFRRLGVGLFVLGPGAPIGRYHWEGDQEDFLLLSGEAVLIVKGGERRLRPWDFVHCPQGTRHIVVGAGDGPCVVVAVGARERIDENCHSGVYVADDAARRHGASVKRDTDDASEEYAAMGDTEPAS